MNRPPAWIWIAASLLAFWCSLACAQTPSALSELEPNQWKMVSDESVGARFSPGLVFVPKLNRFVLFGGRISGSERPYDVLSFDAASNTWMNDLPPQAKDRGPARGLVKPVKFGKKFTMTDDEGLVRPHSYMTKMWYTYTLAPWDQKIYALVCGHTLCYDPVARTWKDLNPPEGPVVKSSDDRESLNWGSLCADPVNKELLLFGGGGVNTATGAPGSWVYSVENNTWRKLSPEIEPGPRALSPMVCDPVHGKIVLFGGDRLNMLYADTWIYDCKTRIWSEAKPPLSPGPRFGHGMVYLPKSGKILLAGGNGYLNKGKEIYRNLPSFDTWTYDVAANRWELLARMEGEGRPSQKDCEAAVMAAAGDDLVIYVPGNGHSQRMDRTTWMFRADPAVADEAGARKHGVKPGTVEYREGAYDPAWYSQDVPPADIKAHEAFLKNIQPNTWADMAPPKWPENRWGGGWATIAFDPDGDQILHHGGGHSAYFGDEVAHYSIPENRFSIPYRPSFPLEHCGKLDGPGDYSFNRGPWGNHSYHAYAYDPACKRMVYLKKHLPLYDPVKRGWDFEERIEYAFHVDKYHNSVISSPHGAFCWAGGQGLYLLKNGKTFEQLPVKGELPPRFCIDGSSVTYDSKRDVVYLTATPFPEDRKAKISMCGQVWAYDMKTNVITPKNPAGMERIVLSRFARESAYVAHEDLVMFGCRMEVDGKVVIPFYDPAANKWLHAELGDTTFMGHGRHPQKLSANVDLGMAYDSKRGLVWAVLGRFGPGSIKALRIDRKSLNLVPF